MSNEMPFYHWTRLEGEREQDRFGHKIVCGDVNGDGLEEWVISASAATFVEGENGVNPQHYRYVGRVYVYSSDYRMLYSIQGDKPGDRFGTSLALGDINGDGVKEIIIGAPGASNAQWIQCGNISVFSGSDGKLLKKWYGNEDFARMGESLAVLDWDADGIPDIAAVSHLTDPNGQDLAGKITIYSGLNEEILYELNGIEQENLGFSLASGDFNGDGKEEIVMGAPKASTSGLTKNGRVLVCSREHGFIHESAGTKSHEGYGYAVAAGDMDNDSIDELLIGSPQSSTKKYRGGLVSIISVAKNEIIMEKKGWHRFQGIGTTLVPFIKNPQEPKQILIGSKAGIVYLLNLQEEVIHEFNGYEPEAFSHSLAVNHTKTGQWIGVSTVFGLNQENYMSGIVQIFSSTPPFS